MNPGGITWYRLLPCQGHKGNQCQSQSGNSDVPGDSFRSIDVVCLFALPEFSHKPIQTEKLR